MSDILADYRIWKSQQEERIGTHSKRCHLWPRHERCMIHRLAAALTATRDELASATRHMEMAEAAWLRATAGNSPAAVVLTDEEREAIEWAVSAAEDCQHPADDTLRCLLQRHFPASENPPAQDNCPPADENLPSGNDATKMHANRDKFTERENRTCDGLPRRLRAIAADEIEGRRPVLSPANSHDLLAAADEIERLRTAIRRLADQDATLSAQGGNVTVTIDATLTDAEREAVSVAVDFCERTDKPLPTSRQIATLHGLLERIGRGACGE